MAKCKVCSQKFKKTVHNRKYCSKMCAYLRDLERRAAAARARRSRVIECDHCSKTVTTGRHNQRFCCDDCRDDYHDARRKSASEIPKTCPECGTDFISTNGRIYCNRNCTEQANNKRANDRRFVARGCVEHVYKFPVPVEPRECAHCRAEFIATNWQQRYCSTDCRAGQRRIRQRKGNALGEQRICVGCGKAFIKDHASKRFCTATCREVNSNTVSKLLMRMNEYLSGETITAEAVSLDDRNPSFKKVCKRCKKEYITARHAQQFCSKSCSNQHTNAVLNIRSGDYNGDIPATDIMPALSMPTAEVDYYNSRSDYADEIDEYLKNKKITQIRFIDEFDC